MRMRATVVAVLLLSWLEPGVSPVKHVDHVMFTGGLEVAGLVTILRDQFGLPVAFNGPAETPPTPGICISFGNLCLEVISLKREGKDSSPLGNLGNFALQAVDFSRAVDALEARAIDHFPPEPSARWTTIGLRGVDLGFFIEYHAGMEARRTMFRRQLDAQQGGTLGVQRVIEISKGSGRVSEVRPAWIRLLGEPVPGDPDLWRIGADLAARLVGPDDPRRNRMVVAVTSLDAAGQTLQRLSIPFTRTGTELAVDPAALYGLKLVLRADGRNNAQPVRGETITVMSGDLQLKGLLWRPASSVPVPAVLFHHGGGCADVPQAAGTLGPRFAARAYAFLWLYRRGAGASRGQGECAFEQIPRVRAQQGDAAALELQLRLMTTTELSDAMAGVAALKAIPGVDPARIAVAGHSFGGQLALLSGERDRSLKAVLNFAGAAAVWNRSEPLRARLLQAVKGITVPVYLGYAIDDNAEPGRVLGAELARLGKVHQLAIYESGAHNFLFSSTHPSDADIFRFLATHMMR